MKEKETFTCDRCGEEHPLAKCEEFDGQQLCPRCLTEATVLCSWCGERIWLDDNAGTAAIPLCQECRDEHYSTCVRCGSLIRNEDARYHRGDEDGDNPYCPHCFSEAGTTGINDYFYKPKPIFYGEAARFFGVELEIDKAGEYDENADRVLEVANGNGRERIYCKHDGSLEDGFEIVTHPMTLKYHQREMPWRAVLDEAVSMGYTSHKAETCGLHVHVNRNSFGPAEAEQDACIARVLYFFERNWAELLRFSRRTEYQLAQWATRYGYKDQPREILDHAKKGGGGGRYSCVNLQNKDTIEFRIFRGTLKYNTLIATLQLVSRVCDVALLMTDEQVKALSWSSFAARCSEPELIQYLKERRLYVNEPVEGKEEV